MKNKLIAKYEDLKVANVNLQENCKFCSECWRGISSRKWIDKNLANYSEREKPINIYTPWIGDKYGEHRILVVGINMNGYGGYDAMELLVEYAKKELALGKRKIFKSKDYPGTFYYHRLPSYVTILLEHFGVFSEERINSFPIKENLIKSFDYIAITNSIKCSPRGEKGKPTSEMWNNCLSFILREEVKILKPKTILVFGKSDNYNFIRRDIIDEVIIEDEIDSIKFGKGIIESNEFEYYAIPHPTSFGGNSRKLFDILNKIIKEI